MLKTKSVTSAIDRKADGLRILVTRVRGRGLPSSRYDAWMPNLGPSEGLLADYRAKKLTWAAFTRAYKKELFEGGGADRRNRQIRNHGQKFTLRLLKALAEKQNVTLMCHCADEEPHCHRHRLRELVLRS